MARDKAEIRTYILWAFCEDLRLHRKSFGCMDARTIEAGDRVLAVFNVLLAMEELDRIKATKVHRKRTKRKAPAYSTRSHREDSPSRSGISSGLDGSPISDEVTISDLSATLHTTSTSGDPTQRSLRPRRSVHFQLSEPTLPHDEYGDTPKVSTGSQSRSPTLDEPKKPKITQRKPKKAMRARADQPRTSSGPSQEPGDVPQLDQETSKQVQELIVGAEKCFRVSASSADYVGFLTMLQICSFNSIGKFTELKYPQQNFRRPHDLESSMLGRHITLHGPAILSRASLPVPSWMK